MGHDHDHGELFAELAQHLEPVLDECPDGVYVWLDDEHKVCNARLAAMFGYATPEEWASTDDFLGTFVDARDQESFGRNYARHVGHLQGPVRFRFKARRKDGTTFDAETDMVPLAFGGHAVAYHFVRPAR